MKKWSVSAVFCVISSAFAAHAADAPGTLTCTKTGREGSTIVLTLSPATPSGNRVKLAVKSKIISHSDIAPTPIVTHSQVEYWLSEFKTVTNADGSAHYEGKSMVQGACLGSCGVNHFSMDVTSQGVGTYKLYKAQFSEGQGRVVVTPVSEADQLLCKVAP